MGELPHTLRVEQLPSGAVYGYVLPDVSRLLLSGYFPGPSATVARAVVSGKKDDSDALMTDDEVRSWEDFKSRLVAWMIRTEGGELQQVGDVDRAAVLAAAAAGVPLSLIQTEVVAAGQPVAYTPEQVEDPEQFPQDDRAELYLRALRIRPAPKAVRTGT